MPANDSGSQDRVLVRLGLDLDIMESKRLCAAMRKHAAVMLDFALVRHFEDAALEALARTVSANSPRLLLPGLSVRASLHEASQDRVGAMSSSRTGCRRSRQPEGIADYLHAVRRFPPLARDEEHDTALRASRGDDAAKQKLVQHNLAFVVAIARQHPHAGLRLEDLVQEGNLGLIRAVEKFDPFAGTRFLTYATWWIRAYLGRYLSRGRSVVRPRSGGVARGDTSLDAPISDGDDTSRLDFIAHVDPGPERAYAGAEEARRTRDALAKVRKRIGPLGWDIVQERLQQEPPKTLGEIGRRWGVSRERVRQIETQTKAFLRRYLHTVRGMSDTV